MLRIILAADPAEVVKIFDALGIEFVDTPGLLELFQDLLLLAFAPVGEIFSLMDTIELTVEVASKELFQVIQGINQSIVSLDRLKVSPASFARRRLSVAVNELAAIRQDVGGIPAEFRPQRLTFEERRENFQKEIEDQVRQATARTTATI